MGRVRIELVGCGRFGESHLLANCAAADREVAAVFDDEHLATRAPQKASIRRRH